MVKLLDKLSLHGLLTERERERERQRETERQRERERQINKEK